MYMCIRQVSNKCLCTLIHTLEVHLSLNVLDTVQEANTSPTIVEVAPVKTEAIVSLIELLQALWQGAQVHLDQGTKGSSRYKVLAGDEHLTLSQPMMSAAVAGFPALTSTSRTPGFSSEYE